MENKNILDPIEVMPLDDLKKVQIKSLNRTVEKLKKYNPLYKEKLKKLVRLKIFNDKVEIEFLEFPDLTHQEPIQILKELSIR